MLIDKGLPRSRRLLLASGAILLPFVPVYAQDAGTASTGQNGGKPAELETIVVSAQLRKENTQVVPIAVTSISGKTIEAAGYQSLTDLQYLVPGVEYDPTEGAAFQIRGVGSESFDFSMEKSVNIVVDDVVMDAQRDNGLTGLEDIQSVDVLMGPQGTLFGKNSTSGVIDVTTNPPVLGQYYGKLNVSYGERNDHTLNATVNLPLTSVTAARIALFDQGQDGFGEYTTLHQKLGTVVEYGGRGKLLYQPSGDLDVTLGGDYERHWDSSIRTAVSGASGTVTSEEIADGVTPGPQNANDADSSMGVIRTVDWGASLRAHYNLAGNTLTSITAYRGTIYDNHTPADLLPATVNAYIPVNNGLLQTSKFSQELRVASPTGQFFEYVGGLFYNELRSDQTEVQWGTLGYSVLGPKAAIYDLTGAKGTDDDEQYFVTHNDTSAAYGQLKFNITPQFDIALGGRYSYAKNSQSLTFRDIPISSYLSPGSYASFSPYYAAPIYPYGSVQGRAFTYRVAPEYKFSRNAMVYATVSTGNKPAGVAFTGDKYDPYQQETVTSYEVGEKSEWFGRRLRVNADLFLENFKDFQTTILTFIPGPNGAEQEAVVYGNAPGLRSEGIELNTALRATSDLALTANVTYLRAYFTNYEYRTSATATTFDDYTGTPLTNAPRLSATIAADYTHAIGSQTQLLGHIDYDYRGKLWTIVGAPAYSEVPGYGLINLRAGVRMNNIGLEVGVYARNLANTYFSTGWQEYGSLGLLHYTSPDAYRTVGGYAKYEF